MPNELPASRQAEPLPVAPMNTRPKLTLIGSLQSSFGIFRLSYMTRAPIKRVCIVLSPLRGCNTSHSLPTACEAVTKLSRPSGTWVERDGVSRRRASVDRPSGAEIVKLLFPPTRAQTELAVSLKRYPDTNLRFRIRDAHLSSSANCAGVWDARTAQVSAKKRARTWGTVRLLGV